ncbi:MAG: hypothetical protein ABR601_10160 [Parasphingopyxis sp.]|nr:hypothetical protein [Sphingomonadales bacterium]
MVSRVALFACFAALPTAAQAIQPAPLLPRYEFPLPYDLTGFVVDPQPAAPPPRPTPPLPARMPQAEPAPPQIAARAPLRDDAAREPVLLAYDLAGFLPPYPRRRPAGPLEYDLGGLLGVGSP